MPSQETSRWMWFLDGEIDLIRKVMKLFSFEHGYTQYAQSDGERFKVSIITFLHTIRERYTEKSIMTVPDYVRSANEAISELVVDGPSRNLAFKVKQIQEPGMRNALELMVEHFEQNDWLNPKKQSDLRQFLLQSANEKVTEKSLKSKLSRLSRNHQELARPLFERLMALNRQLQSLKNQRYQSESAINLQRGKEMSIETLRAQNSKLAKQKNMIDNHLSLLTQYTTRVSQSLDNLGLMKQQVSISQARGRQRTAVAGVYHSVSLMLQKIVSYSWNKGNVGREASSTKMKELEEHSKLLESEIFRLTNMIQDTSSEYHKKINAERQHNQRIKNKMIELQDNYSTVCGQLEALNEQRSVQRDSYESRLAQLEKIRAQSSEEATNRQVQLQQSQYAVKIQQLQTRIDALGAQTIGLKNVRAVNEEAIRVLEKKNRESMRKASEADDKIQALQLTVQAMRTEERLQGESIEVLRRELANNKENLSCLQEANRRVKHLEDTMNEIGSENTELMQQNNRLKAIIRKNEQENCGIRQKEAIKHQQESYQRDKLIKMWEEDSFRHQAQQEYLRAELSKQQQRHRQAMQREKKRFDRLKKRLLARVQQQPIDV